MSTALKIKEIITTIKKLDVKEEIKIINIISKNIYDKVNKINPEKAFWLKASEKSLNKIWNNKEDDKYNELLKR